MLHIVYATDGPPEENHDPDKNNTNATDSDFADQFDDGVRYFHLGAVLALFPGLQLNLLEVFCGVDAGPYTGYQTTDCFGSLLEADGYQRLWMEAVSGDQGAWTETASTRGWKDSITAKFKPHTGWAVRIKLIDDEWEYPALDLSEVLTQVRDAGITLVEVHSDSDCDDTHDSDSDDTQSEDRRMEEDGHESEDTADILADRGDADFVVKPDDNRVLRCIELDDNEATPEFFKRASDALKELFKRNSWESIKGMDGFDDGDFASWNDGDIAYKKMLL